MSVLVGNSPSWQKLYTYAAPIGSSTLWSEIFTTKLPSCRHPLQRRGDIGCKSLLWKKLQRFSCCGQQALSLSLPAPLIATSETEKGREQSTGMTLYFWRSKVMLNSKRQSKKRLSCPKGFSLIEKNTVRTRSLDSGLNLEMGKRKWN